MGQDNGQDNLIKLEKKLKKELDEARFHHTLGVMYTSAALAMRYESDIGQAQLAGLLHDCAKCIPNDKKIGLCEKYHLPVSDVEHEAPFLLHSKLGAYLAEHKYGVTDPEILGAIQWHTTGKPDMTLLEKIVFTADYIEPMRFKAENLPAIRKMAFEDLDMAVFMILRDTLNYLHKTASHIDDMSQKAYNYYRHLIESRTPDLKSNEYDEESDEEEQRGT